MANRRGERFWGQKNLLSDLSRSKLSAATCSGCQLRVAEPPTRTSGARSNRQSLYGRPPPLSTPALANVSLQPRRTRDGGRPPQRVAARAEYGSVTFFAGHLAFRTEIIALLISSDLSNTIIQGRQPSRPDACLILAPGARFVSSREVP